MSCDAGTPPLQLQLARGVLLLGALQLYRFLFTVGCLAVGTHVMRLTAVL